MKGFDEQTQEVQRRYKEALDVLIAPRSDPEDGTVQTSLLALYSRYQKEYYELRRKNEDIIELQQKTLAAIDYELWFQRHYPLLNAENEGAYTNWLLFGEKDLVESYKAHLDVISTGAVLEEARETLRSTGVISLDRSTTIYPVIFTPSDWYQYLIPR